MGNDSLASRIDTIESSYEYLLAYAAQGRQHDQGTDARQRLEGLHGALAGLADDARVALAASTPEALRADLTVFLDAVARDAAVARGAVAMALRREAISSLLVDNLNASVHVRALLTDLFLIEQSLKP